MSFAVMSLSCLFSLHMTTDGWLKTGDLVLVKNDLWWVVDRKKEIIKVYGFQVTPAELDAVLLQHEDMLDAAVVGLVVDVS